MTRTHVVGAGLLALAAGTAANSMLGPLGVGVIDYRYGPSMTNQGIGLDAVALLLVVPVCVVAGVLTLRRHVAGPVLGLGPAAFLAYMLPQYVIGPDYAGLPGNNERFFPFHLLLFVLSVGTLLLAWHTTEPASLPAGGAHGDRRRSWVLVVAVAFILSRWLPAMGRLVTGAPAEAGYVDNPTAYLLVALLDLGLVAPAAVATAVGLRTGAVWARKSAYAVIGWFATVPASVAAMAVTMEVRDDPDARLGTTLTFCAAAVVFAVGAGVLYRPLFRRDDGAPVQPPPRHPVGRPVEDNVPVAGDR